MTKQITIVNTPINIMHLEIYESLDKYGYIERTLIGDYMNDADGYIIYRFCKKSSGFKITKTLKSTDYPCYYDTKIRKTKTYYYKVRSYKIVDGKKVFGKALTHHQFPATFESRRLYSSVLKKFLKISTTPKRRGLH